MIVGAMVGVSVAGGASIAASPEVAEKFASLYGAAVLHRVTVECVEGSACALEATLTAPASADAKEVGVADLQWSERGTCPAAELQKLVSACGARENSKAPIALVDKRRVVNEAGAVVEVASEAK